MTAAAERRVDEGVEGAVPLPRAADSGRLCVVVGTVVPPRTGVALVGRPVLVDRGRPPGVLEGVAAAVAPRARASAALGVDGAAFTGLAPRRLSCSSASTDSRRLVAPWVVEAVDAAPLGRLTPFTMRRAALERGAAAAGGAAGGAIAA